MAKKRAAKAKPPTPEELQQQRLTRRLAGRRAADEIIELISPLEDPEAQEAFWDQLRRHLDKVAPVDISTTDPTEFFKPMSDEDAIRFEKKRVGFGQYEAQTYGKVPLDYLEFLAEAMRPLYKYLKSPRVSLRRSELNAE